MEQTHRNEAIQYLRQFRQDTGKPCVLEVQYSRRNGARLYAQRNTAQCLPKRVRTLFFGSTHTEIDMIAAHLQLFLHAAGHQGAFQGHTPQQLRDKLTADLH